MIDYTPCEESRMCCGRKRIKLEGRLRLMRFVPQHILQRIILIINRFYLERRLE